MIRRADALWLLGEMRHIVREELAKLSAAQESAAAAVKGDEACGAEKEHAFEVRTHTLVGSTSWSSARAAEAIASARRKKKRTS